MLQTGDGAGAVRTFESLWKANPKDANLANAIGAAVNAGSPDEAVVWFNRALKLDPSFAPAYNNLGLNYASRGLFAEALPPLRKALQLDPLNFRAGYNQGLVLIELGRYAEAAAALVRAHRISPEDASCLLRLAYADLRIGRNPEAQAAVRDLLKLPGNVPARAAEAAQLFNSAGYYEAALRIAQDSGASNTPELIIQKAYALLGLKKYGEVVALLRANPPQTSEACTLLGSAQALQGELADAVGTLQTAVRMDPENPDAYYRLGLVFMGGYRQAEALDVIQEGLRAVPDNPRLLNGLADIQDVGGNRTEAVRVLERSVQINPRQEQAWSHLARLYSDAGDDEKALAAYARSLQLGASAETYADYADCLIRLERISEAEKVVSQGLMHYPSAADLHYHSARVYQREEKYAAAETALRKASALGRDDGSVHYMLATVLQKLGKIDEAKVEFERTKAAKAEERHQQVLRSRLTPVAPAEAQPQVARAVH